MRKGDVEIVYKVYNTKTKEFVGSWERPGGVWVNHPRLGHNIKGGGDKADLKVIPFYLTPVPTRLPDGRLVNPLTNEEIVEK